MVAVLVYVGILVGLTLLSVKPLRIPFWISPGSLGVPQEEVAFRSSDGNMIRGWWCEQPDSDKVAIFFHGYMMNRCELVPEAHYLYGQGFSCLLIDFRAHGRSESRPSSVGYRERADVKAAVEFARTRAPAAKRLLIGSSMGSASVCFALADDPSLADAAVIDSAYGRLDLAIAGWWRFLGGPMLTAALYPLPLVAGSIIGLNPFRVDVSEAIAKIGAKPLLFIHGSADKLALPSEAERNYGSAKGPKKIVWFEGRNHSEGRWLDPVKYRESLMSWLEEIVL